MSGWSVVGEDSLRPGTTIGRYTILDEIGRGGMGVVCAAYDPHLDRKVALKLLRPRDLSADPEESRARLLREAQALAKLSHPNVVSVYDAGLWHEASDASLFLAMDFIDGQNLRQWTDAESPSLDSRLRHMVAAGRGLAAAHAAGLLHRDFKPENVMIGPGDRVRVVDFGLAKPVADLRPTMPLAEWTAQLEATPPEPSRSRDGSSSGGLSSRRLGTDALYDPLTRDGSVIGTPAYLAPEVLRGETPDARTDQYSFCVALYELIYGRLPFDAKHPVDLVRRASDGLTEPPAATADCGRVPAWLRSALVRGLQPDSEDRFASLADLLDVLDREPARRRRRRWMVSAAAAAILLLAAAWFVLRAGRGRKLCDGEARAAEVWSQERAEGLAVDGASPAGGAWSAAALDSVVSLLDQYAGRWADAYTEACRATRVYGEQSEELLDLRMTCLDARLRELDALAEILGAPDVQALEQADDAAAALSPVEDCADLAALRQTVARPSDTGARRDVREARASIARARMLRLTGAPDEARSVLRRSEETVEPVDWPPVRAELYLEQGELDYVAGRYEEAREHYLASWLAAQEGRYDLVAAKALAGLARVEGVRWVRVEDGAEWFRMARATLRRLADPETLRHDFVRLEAALASKAGDFDRAIEILREELAWSRTARGAAHPETIEVQADLASNLESSGAYTAALELGRESLRLQKQQLGDGHPDVGTTLIFLGNCQYRLGELDSAMEHYRQAAALFETTFGRGHRHTVLAQNNQAATLQRMGRVREALELQLEVLEAQRSIYSGDHVDIAMTQSNLAEMYQALGDSETALEMVGAALDTAESAVGLDHIERAGPLSIQGYLYAELGRWSEAIGPLEETLRIAEGKTGSELIGEVRFLLARAYWQSGRDRRRALDLAESARQDVLAAGDAFAELAAEIEAWLVERQ